MSEEHPAPDTAPASPTPEPPQGPTPPQFVVPRALYIVSGAMLALWVGVTFFIRNPYTQAVEGSYYEHRTFGDGPMWTVILVVALVGLGAFTAWSRRRQS